MGEVLTRESGPSTGETSGTLGAVLTEEEMREVLGLGGSEAVSA